MTSSNTEINALKIKFIIFNEVNATEPKVTHNKPKEDIWKELSRSIEEKSQQKETKVFRLKWLKVAAAVIFLIEIK